MSAAVTILETVTLAAPLSLQFYDPATNEPIRGGLRVSAAPTDMPTQVRYAVQGKTTGAFSFAHLPGLLDFENGGTVSRPRSFSVTVTDTENRFLPASFSMLLPNSGPALPDCLPLLSPPGAGLLGIPLFTAAPRIPPAGMAVLRADVVDASSNKPAAWALFEAVVDGSVFQGLTDQSGKLLMIFPYPEPAAFLPGASGSPPHISPSSETWGVRLRAFYQPVRQVPPVPDFCEALHQPPALLWSDTSLTNIISPLTLTFGRELIARSWNAANGGPLSTLLLTPVASPLDHF